MLSKPLSSLTIFFPAYNEELNIKNTINQAIHAAKKLTTNYEIIAIDDGSNDNTESIVKQIQKSNSRVKLVSHKKNRGYGAAIKTGFKSAKKDWIFFTDSDGQFKFNELKKFVDARNKADLIIGYRQKRQDPLHRIIIGKYFLRLWNFLLFGLKVKDVDCAYKLFRKELLDSIIITTESAITETEFIVRAIRRGFTYLELPVKHYPRLYGKQTGGDIKVILKALRESIQLWKRLAVKN